VVDIIVNLLLTNYFFLFIIMCDDKNIVATYSWLSLIDSVFINHPVSSCYQMASQLLIADFSTINTCHTDY